MKTKIILVRHGESLGNARCILLGHTDMDLSELGYRQAEATANALKDERIDAVYSSDLLRAFNTAAPNAGLRSLTVHKSKRLREIYLGEWEGKSVADILEKHRDMYENDWLGGYGTFRFPGGESTVEAGERLYAEVVRIAKENQGKTILVASHAAAIRSFFAKVLQIAPVDIVEKLPFPSNASYSEVYFNGQSFESGRFSVDDHLANVGITKYGA